MRTSEHLTLLFRVDRDDEAEALHYWRAAFQGATEIEEALSPALFALHIYPGGCSCADGALHKGCGRSRNKRGGVSEGARRWVKEVKVESRSWCAPTTHPRRAEGPPGSPALAL
jgi:hypothetical protein